MDSVMAAARAAITEHHGIEPHAVPLVEPMRIPTTSSGKIQRSACRQQLSDGELGPVAEWQAPPAPEYRAKAGRPRDATTAVAELVKAARARQFCGTGRG